MLPEIHVDFAQQFWTDPFLADADGSAYNFVRRSEKQSDEMRDPLDRKSDKRYRIVWLEARIGDMYEAMLKRGKEIFGAFFKFSWPSFLQLRPFHVKNATRETCMCVYHLRFREFANGLINYRQKLRTQKVSSCNCSWPVNDKWLCRQLICPRTGPKLDNLDCMMQRCPKCKDLNFLTSGPGSLCWDETRDALCMEPWMIAPPSPPHPPPHPRPHPPLHPPPRDWDHRRCVRGGARRMGSLAAPAPGTRAAVPPT